MAMKHGPDIKMVDIPASYLSSPAIHLPKGALRPLAITIRPVDSNDGRRCPQTWYFTGTVPG